MLDTRFPRLPGDVGHAGTFGGRARHLVVPGAYPREVVRSAQGLRAGGLQAAFLRALQTLEAQGAAALTTSCGFLVLLQDELQSALRVPLVASSLLQLPAALRAEPQVGVLTISEQHLGDAFLLAAGVPSTRLRDVLVQGVDPASEFAHAILGNRPEMDADRAAADVLDAALRLRRRAPHLRTVVLECTNMPPYAAAIESATGWRLLSLLTAPALLQWTDA
jgi:hypothetical protein